MLVSRRAAFLHRNSNIVGVQLTYSLYIMVYTFHTFFIFAGVQGAAKPNLQGGATPVLPRDPRQGVPVGAQVTSAGVNKPFIGL